MKKPLLITTLAAGALLVGGTFAAYVITDNAAQKDVHIGIGNLIIDEDEPITLEWGDGTAVGDVEDLQPGAAKSVGKVVVKATAEDAELVYDGRLDLQFVFGQGSKLDKYLTYHVYADNNGEPGLEIQPGNDGMFAVQGDAAGRTYHITVALAQPTDEDRVAISEEQATLSIDWKAAPAEEPAPQVEYAIYHGAGEDWTNEAIEVAEHDQTLLQQFHVEIELEQDEQFVFKLGETWIHPNDEGFYNEVGEIIGAEGDNFKALAAGSYNMYLKQYAENQNWGIWAAFTPANPVNPEPAQYSVKVNGEAVNQAPEADPGVGNNAVYKINVESGSTIAIDKGEVALHFYHWDAVKEEEVDDGASYLVTISGVHTLYINNQDHVFVEEPAEQQAEAQKVEITLTDAPEWVTSDGAVLFVFTWQGEDQGFHLVDGEMKVEITNDITAFLVARCAEGTVTPNWDITSGDAAGRIYNKTNNIAFDGETTSYSVPESVWVGYPN